MLYIGIRDPGSDQAIASDLGVFIGGVSRYLQDEAALFRSGGRLAACGTAAFEQGNGYRAIVAALGGWLGFGLGLRLGFFDRLGLWGCWWLRFGLFGRRCRRFGGRHRYGGRKGIGLDRKSTRLNSSH